MHLVLTLAIYGMFIQEINVWASPLDELFNELVGVTAVLAFYSPIMMVLPLLHLASWIVEPTKLWHALVGFTLGTIFSIFPVSLLYMDWFDWTYTVAILGGFSLLINLVLAVVTLVAMIRGTEIKYEEAAETEVNYEDEDSYLYR